MTFEQLEKMHNAILDNFINNKEIESNTDLRILCGLLDIKVSDYVLKNFSSMTHDEENDFTTYHIHDVRASRKIFNIIDKLNKKIQQGGLKNEN